MLEAMDLATRRLRIRDLRADDLTAMIELWADEDVGRFMGTCGPGSAEETAQWLAETIEHNRARPRASHNAAIIVAATGERAGWIGCGECSEPVGDWAFGYALRPAFRGHGYAREAWWRSSGSASVREECPRSGASVTPPTTARKP